MDRNYKYKTGRLTIIKIKTEMGKPTGLWIQQLSYVVKVKSIIYNRKNSTIEDTDTVQRIYRLRTPSNYKEELNMQKKTGNPLTSEPEIHKHTTIFYLKWTIYLNGCDYNARQNNRNKWSTFDWHGLLTPPDWTRRKDTEHRRHVGWYVRPTHHALPTLDDGKNTRWD